ncbi:hypothetical protein [Micromonospora pisi]|uniref:hypothetical protein n=1 Tax=Micromonospora pisi TaxID=589240 RepID=UPI0011C35621|nr:hypothetical protein [Micromonospora pisi]
MARRLVDQLGASSAGFGQLGVEAGDVGTDGVPLAGDGGELLDQLGAGAAGGGELGAEAGARTVKFDLRVQNGSTRRDPALEHRY